MVEQYISEMIHIYVIELICVITFGLMWIIIGLPSQPNIDTKVDG